MGWVGFRKSYVIVRVGHGKSLLPLTRWVGGLKKGPKHACVIFEWSLILSKDIDKYVFMCGSNFYETDVKSS